MENIQNLLESVKEKSFALQILSNEKKQAILKDLSKIILENKALILSENKKDLDKMEDSNPKKDRLLLTDDRIDNLANSLLDVAKLEDPTNKILSEKKLENGLSVKKIAVPIGVVGIIYESRPNVTLDVAALCIRSGNAVVLRGGSDAFHSNTVLVKLIHQAMETHNLPTEAVLLLPTDRKFVPEMLNATKFIDIIIPRGSQQLIEFVRKNASVPTIETGAGVCHTYVESSADLDKAAAIVVNAKVSRPSVCNSLDTILVDKQIANEFLPKILEGMKAYNVEIFADKTTHDIISQHNYPHLQKAKTEDFGREFLSYKCSIKSLNGLDEAIAHIRKHSSRHSEAIISTNEQLCNRFLQEIDAAAVFTNASTRFTDGGQFGLGAEIGISTQKLHARGPFALEKLTTEKWIVQGDGQIRI